MFLAWLRGFEIVFGILNRQDRVRVAEIAGQRGVKLLDLVRPGRRQVV